MNITQFTQSFDACVGHSQSYESYRRKLQSVASADKERELEQYTGLSARVAFELKLDKAAMLVEEGKKPLSWMPVF